MPGPRVTTALGTVEGLALEGCQRFAGIPYAAPLEPGGRLRRATPAQRRKGVGDATRFAPHVPQPDSVLEQLLSEGAPLVISERDSLCLNVWTPATDAGRRPVLFFVHGGAFQLGSSAAPLYDGSSFAARHDCVVVSCNYRLGLLGYTHVEHRLGAAYRGSGLLGVLDVVEALRWVREHVESFGGDPQNVTVFGESAGAMTIGVLLALPEAKGLFHKAILQSGAASATRTLEEATAHGDEVLERLGATDPASLGAVPVADLLALQQAMTEERGQLELRFRPGVDGDVLPVAPLEAIAAGAASEVPLLLGTNLDEWRLFSAADPSTARLDDDALRRRVGALHDDPDRVVKTYRRRLGDAEPKLVLDAVTTDVVFRIPAIRLAEAQHRGGGRAHLYLFSWPSPAAGGLLGAMHGVELPFVFNTLTCRSGAFLAGAEPPRDLADVVHATWAGFARTGDVAGAVGDWPAYDPASRATMRLDEPCRLEHDPGGEERELWG